MRPVFLTTATTVLGLAPLLYEGSNQAEFLKPTVITLVYGLAFGTVLVLLIVPSLMAMQDDWRVAFASMRRGARAPSGRVRGLTWLAVTWSAALFVALLLPVLTGGAPWPDLVERLPVLEGGFGPALAAYLSGVLAGIIVIYLLGGMFGRRRRRAVA